MPTKADGAVVLNERWRFRLHHPVGLVPALVEQPAGTPQPELAVRVTAAFHGGPGVRAAGPVWEGLVPGSQQELVDVLHSRDLVAVAAQLAALGRSPAGRGFFAGADQHRRCAADSAFAHGLAAWTYDKLLSLAEAVGAEAIELPENGAWGESNRQPVDDLFARVSAKLGQDLTPPDHVGGYLGIRAGACILQMRVIEAIYAAWRLDELARELGLRWVCEIGAGAGLTALCARLLGIGCYTIIDLPTMNAVQGLLGGSRVGDDMALNGERNPGALTILPDTAFADLAPGSIDLLYNQDRCRRSSRAQRSPI